MWNKKAHQTILFLCDFPFAGVHQRLGILGLLFESSLKQNWETLQQR